MADGRPDQHRRRTQQPQKEQQLGQGEGEGRGGGLLGRRCGGGGGVPWSRSLFAACGAALGGERGPDRRLVGVDHPVRGQLQPNGGGCLRPLSGEQRDQ